MLRLTKRYRFSASHRLHVGALSEEENRRLFGKCNNPYGHGHDYALEVSVEGEPDPRSGLLVDPRALDELVEGDVLERLDRRDMNLAPEFSERVPTTENLALVISGWLTAAWDKRRAPSRARLSRIRIEETPRNFFEVFFEVNGDAK